MLDKKMLVVINPCAGQKRANRYLTDILGVFSSGGYECTVFVTQKRGDATEFVKRRASMFDAVVCIGGDGTFNEVMMGVISSEANVPIGYIPAGSTNDFANSLKLSKDILQAARDIVCGEPRSLDAGSFNGRCFSYIASFGAFTGASYSTAQSAKNALGHLAYILEGLKDLPSMHPVHVRAEIDNKVFEDDYIFGAVSNSTSIAGIVTLDDAFVDMNDGLCEVTLVKFPKTALELSRIIMSIQTNEFDEELITFVSAPHVVMYTDDDVPWTLDGEYDAGAPIVIIKNIHNAIKLIVNRK